MINCRRRNLSPGIVCLSLCRAESGDPSDEESPTVDSLKASTQTAIVETTSKKMDFACGSVFDSSSIGLRTSAGLFVNRTKMPLSNLRALPRRRRPFPDTPSLFGFTDRRSAEHRKLLWTITSNWMIGLLEFATHDTSSETSASETQHCISRVLQIHRFHQNIFL